ncbi:MULTISPECIES: N-acetyltransferase [Peptoniphilus]|uniref:GNAT family N-acetyltransferase n=1 Tax=Peptoniphilus TaxID=162289 RepID=UPI0001DA9B33|nr:MULTISPECIES: GNAT family N-acetyltransferase [Peptoniphilus]EFI42125.1 acetyltransferase, GNAT family [Peptoniphilus sp. oral taxon 386 str. F0131]
MIFRRANNDDIVFINKMYGDGSKLLGTLGVDQWQNDEMPSADLNDDIYVLDDEGIVATAVLMEHDKQYDVIYEGKWISDDSYFAIHRVATSEDKRQMGYAKILFDEIEKFAILSGKKSLKVDTHRDNIPMQNFLKKMGYVYCGVIILDILKERLAFEKILK